jgi:hypothetical protein
MKIEYPPKTKVANQSVGFLDCELFCPISFPYWSIIS